MRNFCLLLLLAGHHEGGLAGGGLSLDGLGLGGGGGASVVDVAAGGVFEALVEGLLFVLGGASAVGGGLEDLEVEVGAVAGGESGTAAGEAEALVLGEGVGLAVAEAEAVGALVLGEGAGGAGARAGAGVGAGGGGGSGGSGRSGAGGRSGTLGGDGVDGIVGDQALILAVLDADVTFLTPGGTPGVLDDPVLGGEVEVHTDEEDTVVDLGGDAVGHDTTGVCLPRGGIDGDGDGADLSEGGGDGGFGVVDGLVGGDLGDLGLAGVLAGGDLAHAGDVGVGRFGGNPAGPGVDGKAERILHQSTIATVVSGVAGDELLFGDGDELVAGEEPGTFDTTGGGEGPARAALALVLDGSDGALLAPVDLSGGADLLGDVLFDRLVVGGFTLVVSFGVVVDLEFFGGHEGELVVAELGEGVLGVHFVSDLHVGVVDLLTLEVFGGGEGLVVETLVLVPRRVSKGHLDEGTKSDDDKSEAVVEELHFFTREVLKRVVFFWEKGKGHFFLFVCWSWINSNSCD